VPLCTSVHLRIVARACSPHVLESLSQVVPAGHAVDEAIAGWWGGEVDKGIE